MIVVAGPEVATLLVEPLEMYHQRARIAFRVVLQRGEQTWRPLP